MSLQNNPELYWLALVTLATALMWVPHILQIIVQEGLFKAVYDPSRATQHTAVWAQRARRAHWNAIENLAIFAPLAILLVMTETGTAATATAAMVFFFARVAHFVVYALAIPVLRVTLFLVGWACQMVLAFTALGLT